MFRFITVFKTYRLGQYKIKLAFETWPGSKYIFQIERGKFVIFEIKTPFKHLE
tara:strand:+ start:1323 stop:1481 length:159 start_codon:yes stop_codon:yes gene_type:complete